MGGGGGGGGGVDRKQRINNRLQIRVTNVMHLYRCCHLRKPRVLTPLRSLRVRKERSGVSTLGLRRCGVVGWSVMLIFFFTVFKMYLLDTY